MKFSAFAETVKTGIEQFIGIAGEGRLVQAEIIREKITERFLARIIGGVLKHFRAEIFGETDDFKQMAVAITGQSRDAHAGEDFSQPSIDGGAGFFRAARLKGLSKLI